MRRRAGQGGFTLLEVMVALAILAMSLVVLLEILTNNVRTTNHAKMVSAATFLARAKMIELEQYVLDNGFGDLDEEDEGDFEDDTVSAFRWRTEVIKVELPTDVAAQTQQAAEDVASSSNNPLDAMQGLLGGLMGAVIEPIRLGLEASVRRVTVTILWDEHGRPNQSLEVVTFMTDPARLDMAIGGAAPAAGGSGASGDSGAGPGSGGGLSSGGNGSSGGGRGSGGGARIGGGNGSSGRGGRP